MTSILNTHRRRLLAGLIALAASASTVAQAPTFWHDSWMASPQPLWSADFVLPLGVPARFEKQTLRQVARVSVGGARMRVVLSNEDGEAPLVIGAGHVARHAEGSSVVAGSERALRFGGQASVRIPPGARVVSDPVDLALPALARVAVSIYLPQPTAPAGFHFDARQTAYLVHGDHTSAAVLPRDAATLSTRVFLAGVMVDGPQPPVTVVALGDSITDGNGATPDADTRWPDALAERLAPRGVAVLNAGISGARLLRDGMGRSALARIGRDVLSRPGVRTVVVLLGTNDIGWPGGPFSPHEPAMRLDDFTQGYRALAELARAHNVRLIAATLPPFERALEGTPLEGHHSPEKERLRQAVNRWIRESGSFDAVVDMDRVLRDPARLSRLNPAYDSGDHLHPNDAGYRAMAAALELETLLPPPKPQSPTAS
ncbi:MAG TPA: SGNH/GDSL hydrolase family protein [Rhizobacter sp.]